MKIIFCILYSFSSMLFFAQKQKSVPFTMEESVCNIFLQDDRTTTKVLGAGIWEKHFEADGMFPRIECINENGTQGLRLFFHYGGSKNVVDEFELFEIGKGYKKPSRAIILKECEFKSGNRIALGMSKQQIIDIIGKRFISVREKEDEVMKYYTADQNATVLKKYRGVAYFITCRLKNNRLVQYNFGLEYP